MIHRVTTPVATELLTTAAAKAFLRVDHADEDALIATLVSSARAYVEQFTARYVGAQTVEAELSRDDVRSLCRGCALYPRGPMTALTSVTLYDSANNATAVTASLYRAETGEYPSLTQNPEGAGFTSQLTTYAVRASRAAVLVYAAGHTLADLPPALLQAWRLLVADYYTNRVAPGLASAAARALLDPYRTEVAR